MKNNVTKVNSQTVEISACEQKRISRDSVLKVRSECVVKRPTNRSLRGRVLVLGGPEFNFCSHLYELLMVLGMASGQNCYSAPENLTLHVGLSKPSHCIY